MKPFLAATFLIAAFFGGASVYSTSSAFYDNQAALADKIEAINQRQLAMSEGLADLQYGVALPQGSALFETSLATRISTSDTSMTLVAASTTSGEDVTGYNCFTIDGGRSDSEFVCGTVSGKTVSSLERGLSFVTATTTAVGRASQHRVGANVKITEYPLVQRLRNQASGTDTYAAILQYATGVVCGALSSNASICDKAYIDGVVSAGASNANTTTKGIVEIATQTEAASSTLLGATGAFVVYGNGMATDTPNTATKASRIVMSDMLGYIKQGWLNLGDAFTFTSTTTHAATSTFYGPIVFGRATTTSWGAITASSSVPTTDASGAIIWTSPNRLATTTRANITTSGIASSTAMSFTLPANTLGVRDMLRIKAPYTFSGMPQGSGLAFAVKAGGVTIAYASTTYTGTTASGGQGMLDVTIMADGASNSQEGTVVYTSQMSGGDNLSYTTIGTANGTSFDSTASQTITLVIQGPSNGQTLTVLNSFAEILKH